jgi:hypothetical protein
MALVGAAGVSAEEVAKTFTVTGHANVKVSTDDGSVRVSTGDIKQVEIRVIYTGYKLDKDLHVSTMQNGDSVEVEAKTSGGGFWNWGVRHSSLRVEVHMPKDADLTVATGDGSVDQWESGCEDRRRAHCGAGRQGNDTATHRGWID